MKVVWSHPADNDLREVLEYIAQDDLDAAFNLRNDLLQASESLQRFPQKGRPGRVPGTRELVVRHSYLLIYETAADEVTILSVLHTSRQYPPMESRGR